MLFYGLGDKFDYWNTFLNAVSAIILRKDNIKEGIFGHKSMLILEKIVVSNTVISNDPMRGHLISSNC